MDTWAECEKHYFPSEYVPLWNVLNKYVEEHSVLPSFEAINLFLRDGSLRDKFNSLEKAESIDIDCPTLLEYLKNEYVQIEAMTQLENYLENIIAIESASESIEALQSIVLDLEEKVELQPPGENMQKMELINTEEELKRMMPLTLNEEFDRIHKFGSKDLVLLGGYRGSGKSVTCANIATNLFEAGNSVMYFTIEMTAQEIMQRCAAIATNVPAAAIRNGNLSVQEWQKIAEWWSGRFEDGERFFHDYLKHHDFRKLHKELIANPLREKQLDIVYNPSLTLANIRTELDKKVSRLKPKVIIVDYINQVKRGVPSRMGQYDWTEQIEVAKALKTYAQEYDTMVVSPYQIDKSGEARFAKGILDSADAAWILHPHSKEDNIIDFTNVKMRNDAEADFCSVMDWTSLRIGPETGVIKTDETVDEEAEDVF